MRNLAFEKGYETLYFRILNIFLHFFHYYLVHNTVRYFFPKFYLFNSINILIGNMNFLLNYFLHHIWSLFFSIQFQILFFLPTLWTYFSTLLCIQVTILNHYSSYNFHPNHPCSFCIFIEISCNLRSLKTSLIDRSLRYALE